MKQEMEKLMNKLEIQQYAARYLLNKYDGLLDDETVKELRSQMMANRLGQHGLRSLNNQKRLEKMEREREEKERRRHWGSL